MRNFDLAPYTPEEVRVCDYLRALSPDIGCGDDPIGFLIASHAALRPKPSAEMTVSEKLETLRSNLYTAEFGDWVLEAETILTEPVCPSAIIRPEEKTQFSGFMATGETILECVEAVILQAYDVLILREAFETTMPWTNFEDEAGLAAVLAAIDRKR